MAAISSPAALASALSGSSRDERREGDLGLLVEQAVGDVVERFADHVDRTELRLDLVEQPRPDRGVEPELHRPPVAVLPVVALLREEQVGLEARGPHGRLDEAAVRVHGVLIGPRTEDGWHRRSGRKAQML
jgi:hypothetical protein